MRIKTCSGAIGLTEMKRGFLIVLITAGCLMAASRLHAQAPASQNTPANTTQAPATTPAKPAESNPFPGDITNVPVMPSRDTPTLPAGANNGAENLHVPLSAADVDPVHSPDDAVPDEGSA